MKNEVPVTWLPSWMVLYYGSGKNIWQSEERNKKYQITKFRSYLIKTVVALRGKGKSSSKLSFYFSLFN